MCLNQIVIKKVHKMQGKWNPNLRNQVCKYGNACFKKQCMLVRQTDPNDAEQEKLKNSISNLSLQKMKQRQQHTPYQYQQIFGQYIQPVSTQQKQVCESDSPSQSKQSKTPQDLLLKTQQKKNNDEAKGIKKDQEIQVNLSAEIPTVNVKTTQNADEFQRGQGRGRGRGRGCGRGRGQGRGRGARRGCGRGREKQDQQYLPPHCKKQFSNGFYHHPSHPHSYHHEPHSQRQHCQQPHVQSSNYEFSRQSGLDGREQLMPKEQKNVNKKLMGFKNKGKKKISSSSDLESAADQEKSEGSSSEESPQIRPKKGNKRSGNKKDKPLPKVNQDEIFFENPQLAEAMRIKFLQFFEMRKIRPLKRQKILKFLSEKYENPEVSQNIIQVMKTLQTEGYISHFCYKNIIRIVCNENFDLDKIKRRLFKKMQIQNKKMKKEKAFVQMFSNPPQIDFLEQQDLLQNQKSNNLSVYLVDGNNCMVTQKHFRSYFQSPDLRMKAQAQIRLQWLLSLAIEPKRCYLFFDDQFQKTLYDDIKSEIMYESEVKQMDKIHVIYAQKNQQADQKIRDQLHLLKKSLNQDQLANIILVTADKVLTHQCYEINILRKSSGLYLFKFSRKMIKKKFQKDPLKKGILGRIFMYRFQ